MKTLDLVKNWNDCKVKAFLKKEVGIVGLTYQQRREEINRLAKETDKMVETARFVREIHGYFFYQTEISAIEPDIWNRADGGYNSSMGEPLEPSEYTQRYERINLKHCPKCGGEWDDRRQAFFDPWGAVLGAGWHDEGRC